MSFKEQLRDEILPRTVEYYNGGDDINSAIVKAASDFKLNVDQTDRLVETMNTARVIAHYEKNASDRTSNCDIADKDTVRRMLFEDKTEKKASFGEPVYDYDFYGTSERNYRVESTMVKAAEEIKRPKSTEGYSKKQIVERVVKYASELETRRRFAEERVGMAQSLIASRLSKVARQLSAGYEPEERYALFKAACKKYPTAVMEIEKLIPPQIVKGASAFARKFNRMNVIDDTPVAQMKQAAVQLEKDIANTAELAKVAECVAEKEAEVKKLVSDYAATEKRAQGFPDGDPDADDKKKDKGNDKKDSDKGDKDGKKPSKDPWMGKAVKFTWQSGKNVHNRVTPSFPGEKGIYEYLTGSLISPDAIDKAIFPEQKKDTSIRDYINNIRRSAILSELKNDDPILSEADPKSLTTAYELLSNAAPEASLNKEIVRAILRQSVNSVAVSPFDAKQWADLDNVLLKNRAAMA